LKFRTLGAPWKKTGRRPPRRVKKEGKNGARPVIMHREKVRQLHGQGNSVRIIVDQPDEVHRAWHRSRISFSRHIGKFGEPSKVAGSTALPAPSLTSWQ